MSKIIDLTGQTFGRLKVLYRANDRVYKNGTKSVMWHCICSCENKTELDIAGSSLRNGLTKSCGCLKKEIASKIGRETIKNNGYDNKKYNKYDLVSYEYGVGYTTNTNKKFLFDKEDFDLIRSHCWRENVTSGYIVTSLNNQTNYPLHRLIMKLENTQLIDHINRDRVDNRKCNLRICTVQQNNFNKNNKNNFSSGHKGVGWNKLLNKWEVYIQKNYKRYRLGYFSDLNEAIKIREQAEDKYFGDFSYNNSYKIALKNT